MNWQLQYVIGFVMLSTMEVDMSEEIRTKSQELLRKEFGISKEEWVVFTKQVAREGKILHARPVSYTHLTLPTKRIV